MSVIHVNGTPVAVPGSIRSPWYALLFLLCLEVVAGNVLLIITVFRNKTFGNKSTTNYFIISLAVADLIVGTTVMPSGIVSLITEHWVFGQIWCEMWQTLDFFACTASILNLCCVSLDRYWAITDPLNYTRKMTKAHVGLLIATVWMLSAVLTFPPMIWHRIYDFQYECVSECHCNSLYVELGHVLFLTITTFFIPLVLMLCVNYRIYKIAIKQVYAIYANRRYETAEVQMRRCSSQGVTIQRNTKSDPNYQLMRKQYKVTKTLGIVMGVFVVCWLPYFVIYTGNTIYPPLFPIIDDLFTVSLWLGWINSGMNPVIYTILSKKFRKSFAKTIFCRKEPTHNNSIY